MGRYRVYRQIGSGGMGIICEAGQVLPSGEERPVALKWIHPELGQDVASIRRFGLEARLHARVSSHPNVVAVYEVDRDQHGRPFMALEYIEGVTLNELAAYHASLPYHVVRTLLDESLDALGYMHARGVLHRDLSLKNIMISIEGRVKVLDLGLARFMDGEISNPGFMGTPAYASPEVLNNAGAVLGPAADLYSLSAIGYRLLTGKAPFGDGVWTEIRERMETWQIDPLPDDVPEDLRELITGLLQRETRERSCASAAEARSVLDKYRQPLAAEDELAMVALQACRIAPREEPAQVDVIEPPAFIEMHAPSRQRRKRHARVFAAALALGAVLAIAGVALHSRLAPSDAIAESPPRPLQISHPAR